MALAQLYYSVSRSFTDSPCDYHPVQEHLLSLRAQGAIQEPNKKIYLVLFSNVEAERSVVLQLCKTLYKC